MSETKEPKAIKWVLVGLTIFVGLMVLLIGAGAFTLSYQALYDTAIANGVGEKWAWIWPLLIDIPLAVFTIGLLVAQVMRSNSLMWLGLIFLYTLATIGFNLAHAKGGNPMAWIVAVVAPVGLLLTTEALRHLAKEAIERAATITGIAELAQQLADKKAELEKLIAGKQAELTTAIATAKAELEKLKAEAEAATGNLNELNQKRAELEAEVETLKRERRAVVRDNRKPAGADISDDTSRNAITILLDTSRNGVEISGSELGRRLGKSDSLGRQLYRRFWPVIQEGHTDPEMILEQAGSTNGNGVHQ